MSTSPVDMLTQTKYENLRDFKQNIVIFYKITDGIWVFKDGSLVAPYFTPVNKSSWPLPGWFVGGPRNYALIL